MGVSYVAEGPRASVSVRCLRPPPALLALATASAPVGEHDPGRARLGPSGVR